MRFSFAVEILRRIFSFRQFSAASNDIFVFSLNLDYLVYLMRSIRAGINVETEMKTDGVFRVKAGEEKDSRL